MRVHYSIHGSFTVPEGSQFAAQSENLIRLPGGEIMSIHPIVEIASGENADDHRNLSYDEAAALGIVLADYDRTSIPW